MADINDLTQNVTLWNNAKTKNISTITDVHSEERLAVSTRPLGEVNTDNSTSTPLAGGATYTGTWHDVIDATHIVTVVTADVASATDGVRVEWSSDGATVLDVDAFTLVAGATKVWSFGPTTKYFRVKFTNGASAQSTFEISTLIKTAYQKSSSHRIAETISNQDDAELVKAVLTGEDSAGDFQNVATTTTGLLRTETSIVGVQGGIPICLNYNKALTAVNANEWQELASFTVPPSYKFIANSFDANSATAGETARAYEQIEGGTFDCPTDTFTDGSAFSYPQFGNGLFLYVTTATPAIPALGDDVTITYTNEAGTTGRTATVNVPKSSLVGTALELTLQGSDIGVKDITNVTHSSTGAAGAYKIVMYLTFFELLMNSASTQYQQVSITGSPLEFPAGITISAAILAGTKTSYTRHLRATGVLAPA